MTRQDDIEKSVNEKDEKIQELERALSMAKAENDGLKQELQKVMVSYQTIENAFFWRVSKPARKLLDFIKKDKRVLYGSFMTEKVIVNLREHGLKYTLRKIRSRLEAVPTYSQWMKKSYPTEEELNNQRKKSFENSILFSITVPLFNTPEAFLKEMIDSVKAQTYAGWELCLADGSDNEHDYVGIVCKEYALSDERIIYKKLEKNLGISENTNVCLEMATGDYIALFDHDDILHPSALYEMMCIIDEKKADFIYTDEATFMSPKIKNIKVINFKPDFAPDNLKANNYICHFTAFKRSLLERTGCFRKEFDGSQDHDLMLRLTEAAERIEHIPKVLYFWRAHPASVAMSTSSKNYAAEAGMKAVKESITRMGLTARVESSRALSTIYRVSYDIVGTPKISIVIPTCDHVDLLKKCVESIEEKSTYKNYEIILVENNSKNIETFNYYKELTAKYNNIKLIYWTKEFNYSAINNYGVKEAAIGEHILLLNNDTEVVSPGWIEEMLMYSQRSDVGAVGAKLYYADDTIQHAGVIIGKGGVAGHAFYGMPRDDTGYMGKLWYAQDVSAVTAACMMIRRDVWEQMGGLTEEFPVAFNDIDLCMRIRKAGYLIVWTPYAELYHYESKSRGLDDEVPEKKARLIADHVRFTSRWSTELEAGDPYYNPNFTLDPRYDDYTLRLSEISENSSEQVAAKKNDGKQ